MRGIYESSQQFNRAEGNNGTLLSQETGATSSYLSKLEQCSFKEEAFSNDSIINDAKDLTINKVQIINDTKEVDTTINKVQSTDQDIAQAEKKLQESIAESNPSPLTKVCHKVFDKEMRNDFKRFRKWYVSDWTDAFQAKRQIIPAILFLYFACVAPAISFGTIASQITNGSMGVAEFLLSAGLSGMAYALLSGQPMAFIAPTGLTLAFTSGLYSFCAVKKLPFFPIYSWVGIWTSIFMTSLGIRGASKVIRYCTHFTDEVFNALLSVNFIYEAIKSLRINFILADPNNLTMPFVSLAMAFATFRSTMKVTAFNTSKYFNQKVRNAIKDFGPIGIIMIMTLFNQQAWLNKFQIPTLAVSNTFQLAAGRDFLIPITSISLSARILCALPAVLLTCLFFMDQNISVRLVNNAKNGLKKGPAYNQDMVALGIITGGLSLIGLPWMCGATVQSMNHVRAMTRLKYSEEKNSAEIETVTETRLSGFVIHAMIASTVLILPLLKVLPIPVVSGIFLFLGRKLMSGNSFLARIRDSIAERRRLPADHPIKVVGRRKVNIFTSIQLGLLFLLWKFKEYPSTAMFFPSVIGLLMLIRSFLLPRYFTEKEFVALGDPTPS